MKEPVISGSGYVSEGLRMLPNPDIRWLVLLPLLINTLVLAAIPAHYKSTVVYNYLITSKK